MKEKVVTEVFILDYITLYTHFMTGLERLIFNYCEIKILEIKLLEIKLLRLSLT